MIFRSVAMLAFLLLSLIPFVGSATSELYFIAVNDELPELTRESAPIRVSGITYLPVTLFDRRISGVNLGVSYGWDSAAGTVSLYTAGKVLEFDLEAGTAYGYDEEQEYPYQAMLRNGIPYVPAANACRYFGIECAFLGTEDGKYSLLRLKNGQQVLDDLMFIRTAKPIIEERAAKYNKPEESGGRVVGPSTNGGTPVVPSVHNTQPAAA